METKQPTKEQVRDWMQERQAHPAPPQTPAEVRRQLGWDLIQAERKEGCK